MTLRDHLQAIYDQHGRLTPVLVMEAARPEDHPLHASVFDRPIGEAAEAWYLDRAHELIRRLKIVYREAENGEPAREVRAFHAIRGNGETEYAYEPIERITIDPMMRRMLVRDAEREWKTLKAKYEHLREFMAIVASDLTKAA